MQNELCVTLRKACGGHYVTQGDFPLAHRFYFGHFIQSSYSRLSLEQMMKTHKSLILKPRNFKTKVKPIHCTKILRAVLHAHNTTIQVF